MNTTILRMCVLKVCSIITSFSYAVGNNTLSNTSTINDDTQNEQVCFDDDSNVSRFSLATWNVGGTVVKT